MLQISQVVSCCSESSQGCCVDMIHLLDCNERCRSIWHQQNGVESHSFFLDLPSAIFVFTIGSSSGFLYVMEIIFQKKDPSQLISLLPLLLLSPYEVSISI